MATRSPSLMAKVLPRLKWFMSGLESRQRHLQPKVILESLISWMRNVDNETGPDVNTSLTTHCFQPTTKRKIFHGPWTMVVVFRM